MTERRVCLTCWGYGTLQDDDGVSHQCPDCEGTGNDHDEVNELEAFRRAAYTQLTGRLERQRRTYSGTRRV